MKKISDRVISTDFQEPNRFQLGPHTAWLVPCLLGLERLSVYVKSDVPGTYATGEMLMHNAPNLKKLTIRSVDGRLASLESETSQTHVPSSTHTTSGAHKLCNLQALQLYNLELESHAILHRYLDIGSLRSLQLYRCRTVAPVLNCLTAAVSKLCCLEELEIVLRVSRTNADDIRAVDILLKNVHGIRSLWLDVGRGPALDIAGVCQQGTTLRNLGLASTASDPLHLAASDLAVVLNACPKLKGLAINFCPIDLGSIQLLGSGQTVLGMLSFAHFPTELEAFLVRCLIRPKTLLAHLTFLKNTIAKHEALRTLRMLSLPMIDYGGERIPTSTNDVSIDDTEIAVKSSPCTILQQLYSRIRGQRAPGSGGSLSPLRQYPARNASRRTRMGMNGLAITTAVVASPILEVVNEQQPSLCLSLETMRSQATQCLVPGFHFKSLDRWSKITKALVSLSNQL